MLSRDTQLRNFQTVAPVAQVERPLGSPTPMHEPGINLSSAAGVRTPGTNYIEILVTPTPQAGMSNPRTAGTRTVPYSSSR